MSKKVSVSGYYRSSGTYVNSYTRSAPSGGARSSSSAAGASAGSSGTVSVSGYTRSSGTYVQPYTRSAPSASGTASPSASSSGTVNVSGYYRADGTYVKPYTRSTPTKSSSASGTVSPSASSSGTVNVSGYYRTDGTYVKPYTRLAPGSRSASNTSSNTVAAQDERKVYANNPLNRKLGRVGMPLGSMPDSGKRYVDNAHNRRLGRVGKLIPPRKLRQREIMEENTVQDIISQLQHLVISQDEYDDWQTAADRLTQQQVEEMWREENISLERPDLPGMLKISYEDLKVEKDPIGHGAFGTVFACLWKGKPAAYKKFLHQHMSKRAQQDFVKEIEILVSLDHPHIVKLYGAVLEEQCLGLVMEYMSRTLFQALFNDESEFENEKKMEMVSQLAEALQYLHMHSKQIAHCDIKCQNVLLDKNDNAKLSDFGLSSIKNTAESSQSSAAPVAPRGTPRYSAPEVLRGEFLTQQQLFKADIYSLAICIFEIVTEEEAYYGLKVRQLEVQVGRGKLRPTTDASLSDQLSTLLESCWDSNAEKRPTTTKFIEQWGEITNLLA